MTPADLRLLKRGDRVLYRGDGFPAAVGTVNECDDAGVEIYWPDLTSSMIWFAHADDGRDARHLLLHRAYRGEVRCVRCGTMNAVTHDGPDHCRAAKCGHRVDLPLMECGCPRCVAGFSYAPPKGPSPSKGVPRKAVVS